MSYFRQFTGNLVTDVARAINGEYHAIQYYTALAQLAPTMAARDVILSIRQDEIRHYHMFTRIYYQLTGRYPQITAGELPLSYVQGLRFAIQDELETTRFYQQIAASTNIRRIRMAFLRASRDEYRHAQWFTALLNQVQF